MNASKQSHSMLASVNEFSHLFPGLDDDLSAVGKQFTYDQHRVLHNSAKNPIEDNQRQARGSTPDTSAFEVSIGDESDALDVDVDADLSLDLLACSSYGTEVRV